MAVSKKALRSRKVKPVPNDKDASLDIVFSGPLLFVPAVSDGNITSVEVFSPRNGHPVGAVFLPGVIFSDAELNDPKCERWPEPESFSLLDPHSYSIDLTQPGKKLRPPFPATAIPDTNHKVKPGRRISGDWEIAIDVKGQLSGWSSHGLAPVTEGMFHGSDSPTTETVALTHRLTYRGVKGAEFCGAPQEAREYLSANISKGGTLIVLGELAYHPTLLHERMAIDSLAKLAGLNLHLTMTPPVPSRTRLMNSHVFPCGISVIVV
jgi:hypothetical protein